MRIISFVKVKKDKEMDKEMDKKMDKKIKILYYMDGIGNGGGIQEMVAQWVANFDNNKVQVDIIAFDNPWSQDNYAERIESFGGKVYLMPPLMKKKTFIKSLKAFNAFFKEHHDYDIIHAHGSSKAAFVLWFAKKYGIKRRILHSHCTEFVVQSKPALLVAYGLKPVANLFANEYFACSSEAGAFLFGEKRIEEKKVRIVHNAIDTTSFYFNPVTRNKLRKELGVEGKIVLGNVGRMRRQKNHSFLLDIFKAVLEKETDVTLLLIGRGELEEILREKAVELGIDNSIQLLGYRNDVNDLMQAMDILVMPSLFEGLPVTGVEAQAVGLPCVFSDTITKEAPILQESTFASLSDPPEVWADRILSIVKSYKRQSTSEYIKEKGYDIATETKKLESYYLNM